MIVWLLRRLRRTMPRHGIPNSERLALTGAVSLTKRR